MIGFYYPHRSNGTHSYTQHTPVDTTVRFNSAQKTARDPDEKQEGKE